MSEPRPGGTGRGDEAELAQFGYRQSMERHTGRFASFAVAFAFVSIATGIIYAATVVMYLVKRKDLPVTGAFELGAWEKPILGVAVVWLIFELALFRDASFKDAWLYVIVMVVIGGGYLGYLLARRGRGGLAMPDQHSIDAVLDQEAGTARP